MLGLGFEMLGMGFLYLLLCCVEVWWIVGFGEVEVVVEVEVVMVVLEFVYDMGCEEEVSELLELRWGGL